MRIICLTPPGWAPGLKRSLFNLWLLLLLTPGATVSGQPNSAEGKMVVSVELLSDGPVSKIRLEELEKLIVFREGEPYSASKAHYTISQIYATGLFHDVHIEVRQVDPASVSVAVKLVRRFRVSRIEYRGDLQLNQRELRRELALREGQAFSNRGVEETISLLKDLYRRNGFYTTTVETEFQADPVRATVDLTYHIEAGQRATITSIEFDLEGELSRELLETQTSLREGMPYSERAKDDDLNALGIYLAMLGYFRAEIYLRNGVRYDPDANAVSLTFRIVPHSHTVLAWTGMRLSETEIRKLPLFRSGTVGELPLEETRKWLLIFLQRRGYALAQVAVEPSGPRYTPTQIDFRVEKGSRYELSDIRFEGNANVPSEKLNSILSTQKAGFFGGSNFSLETIESDLERFLFYYEQNGYLDASFEYRLVPDKSRLSLIYLVHEGPLYRVKSIRFQGNESFSDASLNDQVLLRPETPFSPYSLARDRASILSFYSSHGYADADFHSEVTYSENGLTEVVYRVSEGARYYVDEVVIFGHERTRSDVIRRELTTQPGNLFSVEQNLASETNLYDLSIFNRVRVTELPSFKNPNHRSVLFRVEEAKQYTVVYGVGYSYNFGGIKAEGIRGTFGITSTNFLGSGRSLSLSMRAGASRQRGNLAYRLPRVFGRKQPTILSFTVDNEERVETTPDRVTLRGRPYNSFRIIASAQTERVLSRRESLFLRYNFERVRLDIPEDLGIPPEYFREEENLLLSSISLSYLNESRDQPANPQEGFFLSGDLKAALKVLGSGEQFIRFFAQGQHYKRLLPIWNKLVFVSSLRLGLIVPFGSKGVDLDNEIPISERFFAGGATTLRGLPLDLAGPLLRDPETGEIILVDIGDEFVPVPAGGNALAIGNLELRFPIYKFVGGNLFYDVGNVFESLTSSGGVKLSHGVGYGLSFNTPIGPLRIDAAYNPGPPRVEGFNRWNFFLNLGHPF